MAPKPTRKVTCAVPTVTLSEAASLLGIAVRTARKWADPDQGGLFKFEKVIQTPEGMRVPVSEVDRIKADRQSKQATALTADAAARFAEQVHRQMGDQAHFDLLIAATGYAKHQTNETRENLMNVVERYREWAIMGRLLPAINRQAHLAFHEAS